MFSYNKIVTGVLLFGATNASPADKILDEDANKNLDGYQCSKIALDNSEMSF